MKEKETKCYFCGKGDLNPNQQRKDMENNAYCIKCHDLISSHLHKGLFNQEEAEQYKKIRNETLIKMNELIILLKKKCLSNLFNAKQTYAYIKEQIKAENNYSIEKYTKTRNCLKEEEYLEMITEFVEKISVEPVSTHNFGFHKEVNNLYTKELLFL